MKNALINGKNSLPCRISGCKAYPIGMVLGRDLVFERWQEIGQQLRLMEGSLLWWIGDWSNYGEKKYGDKYESAIEATGLAYQTIANARMVAKAFQFSRRRENLTWSHHLEMCSLHESEQDKFLDEAEEEKLSKQELREAIREKRLEQLANEHPLPNGKFSVLYADPPWLYHDQRTGFSDSGAAAAHYPVMPLDSICGLTDGNGRQIQGVIADDAVLFLWATAPCLPEAMTVLSAWGFDYKAHFVWDKIRGFNGHYNDVCHELLLIGLRGSFQPKNESLQPSIISIEKDKHSRKPDKFYEIIEEMYPLKPPAHLEIFARSKRRGWKSWGNEVVNGDRRKVGTDGN